MRRFLCASVLAAACLATQTRAAIPSDLAARMQTALDNFEADRFGRLLVLADVHPSNAKFRVLTNEFLAAREEYSDLAAIAENVAPGGPRKPSGGNASEKEFMSRFDELSTGKEKSALGHAVAAGTYDRLQSAETGGDAVAIARIDKLALLLIRDHPREAAALAKQVPGYSVGKVARVLRSKGVDYEAFLEALKAGDDVTILSRSQNDLIAVGVVIMLVVVVGSIVAVRFS